MITDITYASAKKIEEQLFLAASVTVDDIANCITEAEVNAFIKVLCNLNEVKKQRIIRCEIED